MLLRATFRRFSLGARFDAHKDYYKTLGLARTADKDKIRRAYIAMVKRFHPDKGAQNDTRIKEINEANEVLSDDALRAEYDQARAASPPAGSPGSFQQAYRDTGQYNNPFSEAQRRKAPPGAQFYRDAHGNTFYREGPRAAGRAGKSARGGQDFDAFYQEFSRHFRAMNEQARQGRAKSDRVERESRQEGWSSAAQQAEADWSRADSDYQQMQKQKEERARADLAHNLLHLRNTWGVFRGSAAEKGFWRGLLDAFVYYRSLRG